MDNKDFIKQLCELTGTEGIDPESVSPEDLADLLEAVKTKVSIMDTMPKELLQNFDASILGDDLSAQSGQSTSNDFDVENEDITGEDGEKKLSVRLVDDLGVIIHQLSIAFQKLNMTTVTAREVFDALDKVKKQHFDLVIMDLFIPTDREGFMLLTEIKKIITIRKAKTKIAVITASAKKEYKKMCQLRGADFFFEKTCFVEL